MHCIMWLFTRCVKPCSVMLENARSVILYEMIKKSFLNEPRKGRAIMVAG